MSEWKTYRLGDFIEVQNGYAFKAVDFSEKGVPVIKIKNITSPRISFEDAEYYNGEIDKRLEQFLIKKGDILISMTGSHLNQIASAVGKVGKYQFDFPSLLNQRVGKLYSKDKTKFDDGFLYYFISRIETQIDLVTSAGGSANQANISPSQIKNLELQVPSIKEQKKIASILSSLDEKIELNLQMNQTLEAMAKAIFRERFVNFNFPGFDGELVDGLPQEWKKEKLGAVLNTVLGGTPSTTNKDYWENGTIPWVNSGKVNEFRIIEPTALITELALKNSNTKLLPRGTTVVAITGATLGQVSRLEIDACANQSVVGILESKSLKSEYIYLWTISNINEIIKGATGGAQQHINKNDINNVDFIVPNQKALSEFSNIVNPLFNKITANCFQNKTLIQLRDSLLPQIMTGKIEIQ